MSENALIEDLPGLAGQSVAIAGWLHGSRSGGGIVFLLVRDGTGLCQCMVEASASEIFQKAKQLAQETSLRVEGLARADARAPGGVELAVSGLEIIGQSENYPVTRKAHGIEFLMNRRHLWLRSARQTAILRVRHTIAKAARDFFDSRGFTLIDTPILISGAAEGAGTLFQVDFFGQPAYLAQTGQLYLECACMALRKVYCFGPTFRAEKSKTRRHLCEFWMLEPEVAFAQLEDVIALAEEMTRAIVGVALRERRAELELLGRAAESLEKAMGAPFARIAYSEAVSILRDPRTIAELEAELESDREKLGQLAEKLAGLEARRGQSLKQRQAEALDRETAELREEIRELEKDIQTRPEHIRQAANFEWGDDLGGSDETILSRRFQTPVFITEYPRQAKAFYMKTSDKDGRVVKNMDMLAPEGYGEIIGGSQREDDLPALERRMTENGLNPADYEWYLDLRRYGSVPHAGFGLGLERMTAWICGLRHVRETIPFPRMMGRMNP